MTAPELAPCPNDTTPGGVIPPGKRIQTSRFCECGFWHPVLIAAEPDWNPEPECVAGGHVQGSRYWTCFGCYPD